MPIAACAEKMVRAALRFSMSARPSHAATMARAAAQAPPTHERQGAQRHRAAGQPGRKSRGGFAGGGFPFDPELRPVQRFEQDRIKNLGVGGGGAQPVLQLLIQPMLDDRCTILSSDAVEDHWAWNYIKNGWAWTAYLGREPRLAQRPPPGPWHGSPRHGPAWSSACDAHRGG